MVTARVEAMNGLLGSAGGAQRAEEPNGVQRGAKQDEVVAEAAAPVRVQASERVLGHAAD